MYSRLPKNSWEHNIYRSTSETRAHTQPGTTTATAQVTCVPGMEAGQETLYWSTTLLTTSSSSPPAGPF